MSQSGEVKRLRREAEARASLKRALSRISQTRNLVIYPCPGRSRRNRRWRAEPVSVEKGLDEMRVGVKGQSNWEIARTPRNVFRDSLGVTLRQVETLEGREGFAAYQSPPNSEWPEA